VENLTRKSHLLEVELERTTKQLKEAISIAGEETAKCKAAKEVIKSLTAQVRFASFVRRLFCYISVRTYCSNIYKNNNLTVIFFTKPD
jgi:hypothetical protein